MIQPEINREFSGREIAEFIIGNDDEGIFKSAAYNIEDFIKAIERMSAVGQIIVFVNEGKLWGTLGWVFTTEEKKYELSKQTWRLPDNIVDGEILYLSFISTKGNCDVLAIKDMFDKMGYRRRITKRRGFTRNKWYEHKIFKN